MNNQEILEKLTQLAFKRSKPFCHSCYQEAPNGRCAKCGSDDLCRSLDGIGVNWGTSWIVEEVLRTELNPANLEEAFEEYIRECYPEQTTVGWMHFDTVTLMKGQDPVSWQCALSEWGSEQESEENIISFDGGSTYYWKHELETFISNLSDLADLSAR